MTGRALVRIVALSVRNYDVLLWSGLGFGTSLRLRGSQNTKDLNVMQADQGMRV